MTNEEIARIREVVREVIKEEILEGPKWVTREELIRMTGKCADTIYRWRKAGKVKTKKIAGVIMYQI